MGINSACCQPGNPPAAPKDRIIQDWMIQDADGDNQGRALTDAALGIFSPSHMRIMVPLVRMITVWTRNNMGLVFPATMVMPWPAAPKSPAGFSMPTAKI